MFDPAAFPAWAVPVLIFFARVTDVTLGTVRIVLVARGQRLVASLLGFAEVTIWLAAIGQIIRDLSSIENFLAYGAGFATGTFLGMTLERRLTLGKLLVRIIIPSESGELIEVLRENGYRITHVDGSGAKGSKKVIFSVVRASRLKALLGIVEQYAPKAFYTVEDVRHVHEGVPAEMTPSWRRQLLQPFFWFRKSK
jgi:uncharacterized protein YebE (UPF0316 family)